MSEKNKLNLLSILDSINRILKYSKSYSNADQFNNNQKDFDAVMMNFIIIGEMVTNEFIEKYDFIEWDKIRGFRNIVAYNYFGIDAEEVWQIIQNHIPKFQKNIHKILCSL